MFPSFHDEGPRSRHESLDYDPCSGTMSPIYAEFAACILADLLKGCATFSFLKSKNWEVSVCTCKAMEAKLIM